MFSEREGLFLQDAQLQFRQFKKNYKDNSIPVPRPGSSEWTEIKSFIAHCIVARPVSQPSLNLLHLPQSHS